MSGPEPTSPSVQPRARPRRRSSAASSDTSPVRSTGSSLPLPHIAPQFQGLDEHRSITSCRGARVVSEGDRAVMVDLGVLEEKSGARVTDTLVRVMVEPPVKDVEVPTVLLDGTPAC